METPPKILQISTVASPRNGVGQIVRAIHSSAAENGMQSFVFAGYGDTADSDYRIMPRRQYAVNALKSRLFNEDGFLDSSFNRKFLEEVERLNPDLVHLHNLHGYYTHLPSLHKTLKQLGVPVVITLHDLWLTTGRCAFPPGGECSELDRGSCDLCPHRDRYPAKWIPGKNMSALKRVFLEDFTPVVASQWMAEKCHVPQVRVIPCGIDNSIFRAHPDVEKDNGLLLAVATKWDKRKGTDELIALADNLPSGTRLGMVGKNVPKHPNIIDYGFIDSPVELARLMARSKVLLSAAREESFGLTVPEALATGTPAIVREGTAPAEMIPDKTFVVDFKNPREVLAAIERIGEFVFQEKIFTQKEMVSDYYALYRELMKR